MEEYVGNLWDQWITRTALGRHPEAVVWLSEVEKSVGILFRAMGGDQSMALAGVIDSSHQAKRHWMARLGGTQKKSLSLGVEMTHSTCQRKLIFSPALP
jgi:nitric oxide reductase NorD protein